MAKLDVLAGLATLEEFGVVFEDAEEFVLVRDRALVQHSFAGLPDDVPGQRLEVTDFLDQPVHVVRVRSSTTST